MRTTWSGWMGATPISSSVYNIILKYFRMWSSCHNIPFTMIFLGVECLPTLKKWCKQSTMLEGGRRATKYCFSLPDKIICMQFSLFKALDWFLTYTDKLAIFTEIQRSIKCICVFVRTTECLAKAHFDKIKENNEDISTLWNATQPLWKYP